MAGLVRQQHDVRKLGVARPTTAMERPTWSATVLRRIAERRLPLIVPPVFYQGAEPWRYDQEFAELFTNAASDWRWVPRFE